MADDEQTPSFELPRPSSTLGDRAMERRIAGRLFPAVASELPELREIPGQVGDYEVLHRIGAGGMGVVYAARNHELGRVAALKLLRRRDVPGEARAPLLAEARALAKLSHPNVVQIYEIGEHEGDLFLAMEYVEGENLVRWQASEHSFAELFDVYLQAGRGLAAAHEAGVVHRDFKPANVLVGDDGRVRVADFGLARSHVPVSDTERIATANAAATPRSPRLVGTPGYIAPELLQGSPASEASDQFAFCLCLWEAVAGRRPFDGNALLATADGDALPDPKGALRPTWLRRALRRGLAQDPTKRWPSLAALLEHLTRARRRPRKIALSAGLSLALGALLFAVREPEVEGATCDELPGFLEVWGPTRAQLLRERAGSPVEDAIATSITEELESYATRWTRSQRESCETLTSQGFDRTQACLLSARRQSDAVISRLLVAPLDLQSTTRLLDSLPKLEACTDLRRMPVRGLWVKLSPATPEARRIEAAELDLAESRYESARRFARELADQPGPNRGRALLVLAQAERALGQHERAHTSFERALLEARAGDQHELEHRALLEFSEFAADDLERPELAGFAVELAHAPLRRLGEPLELGVATTVGAAFVASSRGDHDEAEVLLREALVQQQALELPERLLDRTRMRIINARAEQGELEAALDDYRALRGDMRARLGPMHPRLASLEFNLGLTATQLGDWAEASAALERALELQTHMYGPGSRSLAQVETALAEVEIERGHYARAASLAEAAALVQRRLPADHIERGTARQAQAWALLQAGEFEAALVAQRALLDELGQAHTNLLPTVHVTLAWLLCRLDRHAEARAHVGLALESGEEIVRVDALANALDIALTLGSVSQIVEAEARFEAALDALPEDQRYPQLLAEAAWLRARVGARRGVASHELDARAREALAFEELTLQQVAQLEALLR